MEENVASIFETVKTLVDLLHNQRVSPYGMEIFCIYKGITFNLEINHHHHYYHKLYLSLNSKSRITANFSGLPDIRT